MRDRHVKRGAALERRPLLLARARSVQTSVIPPATKEAN